MKRVAVIGGGAAGFYSAIWAKKNHPEAEVILYEKSNKVLAKVRISGGGRCNVTNGTTSIKELSDGYPRGGKQLKKLFPEFNTQHTREWFQKRGVPLYVQDDGRVFPKSDNSQSIIDCLLEECQKLGVQILLNRGVSELTPSKSGIDLLLSDEKRETFSAVIVATGGSPKESGLEWLKKLGHKIESPVPSLFTFNMPKNPITELMGLSVDDAIVSIQGSKLKARGPLLVTHWGMSGPAVLKISSQGARFLADKKYDFTAQVNWVAEQNFDAVLNGLRKSCEEHPKKQIGNTRKNELPERLWFFLLKKSQIQPNQTWESLNKKQYHKLTETLSNDLYHVRGKTTFKEEFVTCGGVSLESVNIKTMESLHIPHLYFAGEVLDIDGITGGYNFQAAWTTAYFAGKLS